MGSDLQPRTDWLRPLWERARMVYTAYRNNSRRDSRRRPASPGEVLALIDVADAAEQFGVPWIEHKEGCRLAGQPGMATFGAGLCSCGLSNLYYALRRLKEETSHRARVRRIA